MLGIIVFSFYVVIPYLLFAVPVQVLFNKHPKKFSLIYFSFYIFFSLLAVFIYSAVLNFDFSMDVLTTRNYYAIRLSASLFFGFGTRSFYKKRALYLEMGTSDCRQIQTLPPGTRFPWAVRELPRRLCACGLPWRRFPTGVSHLPFHQH
ncbi:UPF0715 family protein [Peribacillus sp. N1]